MFDLPPLDCGILEPVFEVANVDWEVDVGTEIEVVQPELELESIGECTLPTSLEWIDDRPSAEDLTRRSARSMAVSFEFIETHGGQDLVLLVRTQQWAPEPEVYRLAELRVELRFNGTGWEIANTETIHFVD